MQPTCQPCEEEGGEEGTLLSILIRGFTVELPQGYNPAPTRTVRRMTNLLSGGVRCYVRGQEVPFFAGKLTFRSRKSSTTDSSGVVSVGRKSANLLPGKVEMNRAFTSALRLIPPALLKRAPFVFYVAQYRAPRPDHKVGSCGMLSHPRAVERHLASGTEQQIWDPVPAIVHRYTQSGPEVTICAIVCTLTCFGPRVTHSATDHQCQCSICFEGSCRQACADLGCIPTLREEDCIPLRFPDTSPAGIRALFGSALSSALADPRFNAWTNHPGQ